MDAQRPFYYRETEGVRITVRPVYLEDQSKDTLLYAGELSIDTDLWGLIQNQIELNVIELTHCTASIKRSATDSTFNFSYIIEAFAGDKIGSRGGGARCGLSQRATV